MAEVAVGVGDGCGVVGGVAGGDLGGGVVGADEVKGGGDCLVGIVHCAIGGTAGGYYSVGIIHGSFGVVARKAQGVRGGCEQRREGRDEASSCERQVNRGKGLVDWGTRRCGRFSGGE